MNERDLEKRLQDVVDGPQPPAPVSLHRFLRELPEAQSRRYRGPLGQLRRALERIAGLGAPSPYARRAQAAFAVAMAVVIGVAGAGLLLHLRQSPVPLTSNSASGPTPPASGTSLVTHQPPVQASIGIGSLICTGVPSISNESGALPTAAVVTGSGKYLGVTGGMFGATGLARSDDGLYWDWSAPAAISQDVAILTSIASNGTATVVTGGVKGAGGTTDGRIWTSRDDGKTWRETAAGADFQGVTVEQVVSGPNGEFIALGWNVAAADSAAQVGVWWSADGSTWTYVLAPIKGSAAFVFSTPGGFVLSGTPLTSSAAGEPPIWWSTDGKVWIKATADSTTKPLGAVTSATVTGDGTVYAVSGSSDGMSQQLMASSDGGHSWKLVKVSADSMPYAASIAYVASLSAQDGKHDFLFATTSSADGAHVWISQDGGVTWMKVNDPTVGGPTGTILLQLGNSYQAGQTRVLSMGEPGSGLGIWLIAISGY